MGFCYVWEYLVPERHREAFEAGYGPGGDWARLFRRDPAYVRTDFLRDREDSGRYLTIDHWTSREACMAFRERHRQEFDAIDARFDAITTRETFLGDFETAGQNTQA